MSANNSLYASSASSPSSLANGVAGQSTALPASRRNSFDMVIAIANSRAAAGTEGTVTAQASSYAASDSSPSGGDCTSRKRENKSFDVESQTWTASFEEVELQDQFWPTPSRLATLQAPASPMRDSDAHAVALAFQAQAQTGKRSLWKEWAPYFGL